MAQVSVVLTLVRRDGASVENVCEACRRLAAAGHEIEVVAAGAAEIEASTTESAWPVGSWRRVPVEAPGRAAAALEGLAAARGEVLLVVDPEALYRPEDIVGVAEAVLAGRGELVVASRWTRYPVPFHSTRMRAARSHLGSLARMATGSSDPLSGLVGLSREALEPARDRFRAVGSQFALELLAKVPGRRFDLPAVYRPTLARLRPGLDDLRHLKRLADHRFGDASRLVQFCAVGASGMIVDLTAYAGLMALLDGTPLSRYRLPLVGFGLDMATAALLAVAVALTWNFLLNRRMTFNDARGGSIPKQYLAYVLSNALAVSVNLFIRLWLPRHVAFFSAHRLTAAVVGIVLATALSFSMARWVVFRRRPPAAGLPIANPSRHAEGLRMEAPTA